jgi:hypothetical protein
VLDGAEPLGHQLGRVFVAELIQDEGAAAGDVHRGLKPFGAVQPRQLQARAQVLFCIGRQAGAALGQWAAQPDGGEGVLHRLACAAVHEDITGGRHGQVQAFGPQLLRHGLHPFDEPGIVGPQQALECHRRTGAEGLRTPTGLGLQNRQGVFTPRDEQHRAIGQGLLRQQILRPSAVLPLGSPGARLGDEFAQLPPTLAVVREHDHAQTVFEPRGWGRAGRHLQVGAQEQACAGNRGGRAGFAGPRWRSGVRGGACDEALLAREPLLALTLELFMCTHHPGHRTLVGKGQGFIAEFCRTREQFFRMRGPGEKAEVAAAVKFGIGRQHTVYLYSISALPRVPLKRPQQGCSGVADPPSESSL